MTRRPAVSAQGFSLVELMVALAILGLMASVVVLTLPASQVDAPTQATRLAARIAALRDRSVIEGRAHSVWFAASGYGFERRSADGWTPIDGDRLARADWPAGMAVLVAGQPAGRVSFDRIGLPDRSVAITLTQGASRAQVTIAANGNVAAR
jgi:general secretion pathway protein H